MGSRMPNGTKSSALAKMSHAPTAERPAMSAPNSAASSPTRRTQRSAGSFTASMTSRPSIGRYLGASRRAISRLP